MRVLVTGGAGFIGSHVADAFLQAGHEVVIIDDLSTGLEENIPPGAEFVAGDITDRATVDSLFTENKFDVINHHAAQMNIRVSVADPVRDARVNILGTIELLRQSIRTGVDKFMFASTGGAVYGEQTSFPADENHATNPISPYGVSKLAGEKYIHCYSREYGLPYCILRYANVYGPRQNPHGEAGVVAIFSSQLAAGKAVTINGDGHQTRDYIYVGDVVAANLAGLKATDNLTINVGTGVETDVLTLYEELRQAADTDQAPRHGPAKPGEQIRSVIDPGLAGEALGWEPRTALSEGLRRTYLSFT
ncbi:MAG: NAD-dependent epimerase/dehydratase family protein [Candidatus Neomarinimicrobiota bacterium]